MAKVDWVLPRPTSGERGNWLSVAAEGRVRELRFAAAGDQLLDKNQIGRNQITRIAVTRKKLVAICHGPGLIHREAIDHGVRGWLENGGKGAGDRLESHFAGGIDRRRVVDLLFGR